jgi:hypothetical protein
MVDRQPTGIGLFGNQALLQMRHIAFFSFTSIRYVKIKINTMRAPLKVKQLISIFLSICTLTASFAIAAYASGVRGTKHDLSVSGPGPTTATKETQICIFCHTPHNASPAYPLWNHELSEVKNYIPYWTETLQSYKAPGDAPPIDGFSKFCLGCHDGTVALGAIMSRDDDIETVPDVLSLGMDGFVGTDLSGTHPVSIIFNEKLRVDRSLATNFMPLKSPPRSFGDRTSTGDPDVLIYPTQDAFGVQCTSCHDPHGGVGGPGAPLFWRKPTHDEVCEVCHEI